MILIPAAGAGVIIDPSLANDLPVPFAPSPATQPLCAPSFPHAVDGGSGIINLFKQKPIRVNPFEEPTRFCEMDTDNVRRLTNKWSQSLLPLRQFHTVSFHQVERRCSL